MANFISSLDCCCSLDNKDSETIKVSEELSLIRQDTGEEVEFGWGLSFVQKLPDGVLLIKNTKWALRKNYDLLAKFDTEAEAQAELKRIVDELEKNNVVIRVKK